MTSNYTDINMALIIHLRDVSHTMRALYEGKGSQKRVLMVLLETGDITQRELTERLGIKPGSASEVIAKLENAGYLTRTPSEADRRTVVVRLTDEGRLQAEQALAQRNKRHEEMFSCLSDEQKQTLLSLLTQVNNDWKTRYPDSEKHPEHRRHDEQDEHGKHHKHDKPHTHSEPNEPNKHRHH